MLIRLRWTLFSNQPKETASFALLSRSVILQLQGCGYEFLVDIVSNPDDHIGNHHHSGFVLQLPGLFGLLTPHLFWRESWVGHHPRPGFFRPAYEYQQHGP